MTQKELLYLEDAIGHEGNIIEIINSIIGNLNNEDFTAFMQEQVNKHQAIKNNLMSLLGGKNG